MKKTRIDMNEKIYSRNDMKRAMIEFGDDFADRIYVYLNNFISNLGQGDWSDNRTEHDTYSKDNWEDFVGVVTNHVSWDIKKIHEKIKQERK